MWTETSTREKMRVAELNEAELTEALRCCLERLSDYNRVSYEVVDDLILYLQLQAKQYTALVLMSVDMEEKKALEKIYGRYVAILSAETDDEFRSRLKGFATRNFWMYDQEIAHREWLVWSNALAALS